jgi:hypothetical protein
MIDPVTLTMTILAITAGASKYVETKRTARRRAQAGYDGEVRLVHLADVDTMLNSMDDASVDALVRAESLGAFLVDGRPLPLSQQVEQ